MRKYTKVILILFILILMIFNLSSCNSKNETMSNLISRSGTMDLSNFDISNNKPILLTGEWEAYYGELLTPEDFEKKDISPNEYVNIPMRWAGINMENNNHATFRLKLKLKDINVPYAIYSKFEISAYKLWVDNKLIMQAGEVANNEKNHVGKFLPQRATFNALRDEVYITMQVSNYGFSNGGFVSPLKLGHTNDIFNMKPLIKDIFIFSSIFVMGLYHLGLYLVRKKDKSTLYFSTICFFIALRTLLMGEMIFYSVFSFLNLNFILKLSVITFTVAFTFLVMFINEIFINEVNKKYLKILKIISAVYVIINIFIKDEINDYFLLPYQVIIVINFLFLLYYVFKAVKNKREGAKIVFSGLIIIFIIVINDALTSIGVIKIDFLLPYGLFIFLFFQSFMLAKKFSKSFTQVENLSNKLVSLDKIKDEFLANTSHELRTPLNGIIGIAQTLLNGVNGNLEYEKAKNLSLIISSGKRLSNIINDILDFSKMKNGDINLNLNILNIKNITQVVIDVLKPTIANRDLNLNNKISDDLPCVYGDENRIYQILYNLIGNAVKFTEYGTVDVYATVKNDQVYVSIKDTGIGIPKEKTEDIFRYFEQLDGSETRKYEGTGLGLNISKYLVELHGGNIVVDSTYGKGSTFTFNLPIANNYEKENNKEIIVKNEGVQDISIDDYISGEEESFNILIADDDKINTQVLVNNFKLKKYNVFVVQDGLQVIEKIDKKSEDYDLIILDVMMPKMSGYEVCKKIRETYKKTELPILLLTAKNRSEDIVVGFKSGANDYLSKPFEEKELISRVDSLLMIKKSIKQEEQLLKSQIIAFNSQIRPHFMFNSLNIIIYQIRKNPEEANKLLLHFTNYLRSCFKYKDIYELISFDEEIKNIKAYLSLEKARFEERLNVVYEIDEDIEIKIPPLILQPIVENAVRHGLLSKPEGGNLTISAHNNIDYVEINVIDDGVGIEKLKLDDIFDEKIKSGIGVKNVNLRLVKLYGHGLEINSEVGKGTTMIIKIPSK